MAISENTGYPRIGMLSMDSQFLQQLAFKGVPQRFAGVHFSAGKFPVTRVWLALRPAREKKTAVGPGNNRGGYINDAMRMRHGSVKRSTASAFGSDAVRSGSPAVRGADGGNEGELLRLVEVYGRRQGGTGSTPRGTEAQKAAQTKA